jgi:exodeoxyribonuclease VII large subunit
MADDAPELSGNLGIYTVSELSAALRRVVESEFAQVRVRGEISGFKRHSSGHLYFALKDAEAVLDAVAWRGSAGRLGLVPEDGLEVIATGRLTTYPGRSKYQIVVERLELAGVGALLKLLEERRRKLAAEGLFDAARKRPLPYLPEVIGVITSPTGAVIRDILHRLTERFPRRVLIWPVAVQGEGAAAQVTRAIEGFNALSAGGPVPRPDLLIVARGGGSLEDLWAFNEESVVRAAAASAIPLIAAVGHETDTTLIDFAADRRAPTPTAAAEMAVPVRADLQRELLGRAARAIGALDRLLRLRRERLGGLLRGLAFLPRRVETLGQQLDDRGERLAHALHARLRRLETRLSATRVPHPRQVLAVKAARGDALARRLARAHPEHMMASRREALARLGEAAGRQVRLLVERQRTRLESAARLLESNSYRSVLERGFVVVRDRAGAPVRAARGLGPGDALALEFHDGQIAARVEPAAPTEPDRRQGSRRAAPARRNGRQGSLL